MRKIYFAILSLLLMLAIGTIAYNKLEGWTYVDSFYFTGVTVTTIGYGELVPTTPIAKIFTVFFGIIGVSIGLFALSVLAAHYYEKREEYVFNQVERVKKLILWNQKHLKKVFIMESKKDENLERTWQERYASIPLEKLPWNLGNASNQLANLIEKKRVEPCTSLDLGCGLGNDTMYLASKGFNITGIDISKTAVDYARERAKDTKCTFIEGNVLSMPFPKNHFDFINDRGCFHNIDPKHRNKFASEIARIMRKDGRYFMLTLSDKGKSETKMYYPVTKEEVEKVFSKYFRVIYVRETKLVHNVSSLEKGLEFFMEKK